jgi:biopolymer transport protein TolR
MGISVSSNRRDVMADINVTPLVDVMLVLLIIFMVAAPMMQEGVTIALPQAPGDSSVRQQKNEIAIVVTAKGDIFVNGIPVEESELTNSILSAVKDNPVREATLRADKTLPYGNVVKIYGALTAAKIENITVITQPEVSGPPK